MLYKYLTNPGLKPDTTVPDSSEISQNIRNSYEIIKLGIVNNFACQDLLTLMTYSRLRVVGCLRWGEEMNPSPSPLPRTRPAAAAASARPREWLPDAWTRCRTAPRRGGQRERRRRAAGEGSESGHLPESG